MKNNRKFHFIQYKVYDLVTNNVIFKSIDIEEISKFIDCNAYSLKKNMNKRVHKSRYYICSNDKNIPTISNEIRMDVLLKTLGLVGKDFYRPTIQDIEMTYNLIKSYNIPEDYFWEFINSKYKKLRWIS